MLPAPLSPPYLPGLSRSHRICYIWELQLGTHTFICPIILLNLLKICFSKILIPNDSFLQCFGILDHFDSLLKFSVLSSQKKKSIFYSIIRLHHYNIYYYFILKYQFIQFSIHLSLLLTLKNLITCHIYYLFCIYLYIFHSY